LINYLKIKLDNSSALRAILPLDSTGSRHSLPFPDKALLHNSNKTHASNTYNNAFKTYPMKGKRLVKNEMHLPKNAMRYLQRDKD